MARNKLTEEEKQAKKAAEEAEALRLHKKKAIHDEIWAIVILAVGVFLALSMFTHTTGVVGKYVSMILGGIVGKVAYALPFFLILFAVLIFADKTAYLSWVCFICSVILFVLLSCMFAAYSKPLSADGLTLGFTENVKSIFALGLSGGGVIGTYLAAGLIKTVGKTGLWIIGIVGSIICALFIFNTPLSSVYDKFMVNHAARKKVKEEQLEMKLAAEEIAKQKAEEERKLQEKEAEEKLKEERQKAEAAKNKADIELPTLNLEAEEPEEMQDDSFDELTDEQSRIFNKFESEIEGKPIFGDEYSQNQKNILGYVTDDKLFERDEASDTKGLVESTKITIEDVKKVQSEVNTDIEKSLKKSVKYKFPSIDLLKKPTASSKQQGKDNSAELSALLEETLASFGVDATVVNVVKGPAVTRFEVQPAVGVKVSKIANLHDDLAMRLEATRLRIEAPIPGKAAVGIEISNEKASTVLLREIVDSKEFKSSKSKITVALGKNVTGNPIVANLKDMPHLLIAGATGSGKSVCINTMLISLMYKASPEEVKLILVDPKVVELSEYNGIPHLLVPVVTEPAKASAALGWAVGEMEERYKKFAQVGVRDLEGYNDYVKANEEAEKVMPQVVIVIDELNDLMMAARNTVEDSICRLAQKARAAGMHLVVATQRPSVNVITGTIKANIPSRIAFAVSNAIDSRTILDMGGAETLLGKGDMLYSPQGSSKPERVQGCFVSDDEVKAVIDYVKSYNVENEYDDNVVTAIAKIGEPGNPAIETEEDDEYMADAIDFVVREGSCSVSMLQRRFRIGYNHAARIVEMMEERGIVGPSEGAKKRSVLMTLEELEELNRALDVPEEI